MFYTLGFFWIKSTFFRLGRWNVFLRLLRRYRCWFWFSKNKVGPFLRVGDFICPLCANWLGAGVLYFIMVSYWEGTTDVPWAFVLPGAWCDAAHLSQLYEFCSGGVLLFVILWLYFS